VVFEITTISVSGYAFSIGDNMISYKRLPGRASPQGLNGFDFGYGWSWFSQYWNVVKRNIKELYDTGPKITQYWSRISNAQQILVARGDQVHASQLDDEMKKIADDLQKWSKVKEYMDIWLPTFAKAEAENVQPAGQQLGAVLLAVLGVAGMYALAYIVNNGMALKQEYAFKAQLTADVIAGKLTTGQMTDILSVPKKEDILEKTLDKVGLGIGVGIPTALLVGGGLYLLFTTGILNKVIGSVFGGSSSTQASGG